MIFSDDILIIACFISFRYKQFKLIYMFFKLMVVLMQNLNLCFLSGGFHHCTSSWSEDPAHKTNCYKIYSVTKGHAKVFAGEKWYSLDEGFIYFINGFTLEKQLCETHMDVHWIHFIPESQFLNIQLNNLDPVYKWSITDPKMSAFNFEHISLLFENPEEIETNMIEVPSLSYVCYFSSALLMLISDMILSQFSKFNEISYPIYKKLKPAIKFINSNFDKELSIREIAQKSFLNPIYFSRLFKQCFKMSPVNYITKLRLNEACILLRKSDLSIQEISEKTGFCNQFYFSKIFKKHFYKTPSQYRNSKTGP